MGMGAYGPAYFANTNALPCLGQTFFRAPEFVEEERKLQTKRDRLRVYAMAAANHWSHFESTCLLPNCRTQRLDIIQKNFAGICQLYGERGVEDIGRSQSLMNPARCWSDRSGNVFEKSDNIVICSLFNLGNFANGETRSLANFHRILLWDLAELCHRLAGEDFNLQPNLKLSLVRPDLAHLRSGITIDHSRNIKAACLREKRFISNVPSIGAL